MGNSQDDEMWNLGSRRRASMWMTLGAALIVFGIGAAIWTFSLGFLWCAVAGAAWVAQGVYTWKREPQ